MGVGIFLKFEEIENIGSHDSSAKGSAKVVFNLLVLEQISSTLMSNTDVNYIDFKWQFVP